VAAKSGLSYEAIRMMIGDSIHYVIHLRQEADGRRYVSEFVRVDKYDQSTDTFPFTAIQ
jgi:Flp pilus assembly CpaF family ATPase